jgi:glycosyltransferase involved in cell wall biosynthesis
VHVTCPSQDSAAHDKASDKSGVLFVVGAFASHGGVQRRVSDLAGSLAHRRSVTILTWVAGSRPRSEIRPDGVRVVSVPSLVAWDRDHHSVLAAINTAVSLVTSLAAALVLRRRWSVACGVGLHPEGTVAAIAARGKRRFVITTWGVGPLGNAERLRRSVSRCVVLALLKGARWIAPETLEAAQELIDLELPRERLTVVIAGVDLSRFRPRTQADHPGDPDRHRPKLAVYAGRLDLRQKRIDVLLDAWWAAALADWELVLAGAGNDETAVRRRARALHGVRLIGWQADVASLLASADLFVLPTMAEGTALTMLEGMACGLPGIVSATPGIAARQPDGVLLAENDVGAWVRALREIDRLGPVGRRAAGNRARAWVETYGDAGRSHARWAELLS